MLCEEILQGGFLMEDKTNIYCHHLKKISYYLALLSWVIRRIVVATI